MRVYVFRHVADHKIFGATRDADGYSLPGESEHWRSHGSFMLGDEETGIAGIDVELARADLDVLDFHVYRTIAPHRAA